MSVLRGNDPDGRFPSSMVRKIQNHQHPSGLEQTNEFLASCLKEFNAQFALDMDCTRSVFEKQPDADKITQFLAVLTPRKIDAGHCIRFRNKYYAPTDEQGCRADFYKGTAAIVIRTLSGKLYVYAMAGKEEP